MKANYENFYVEVETLPNLTKEEVSKIEKVLTDYDEVNTMIRDGELKLFGESSPENNAYIEEVEASVWSKITRVLIYHYKTECNINVHVYSRKERLHNNYKK